MYEYTIHEIYLIDVRFPFSIHSILWHCVSFRVTASNPIQSDTNDIGDMSLLHVCCCCRSNKYAKVPMRILLIPSHCVGILYGMDLRLDWKLIE